MLGTGATPWAALVDLAEEMHAGRVRDNTVTRATDDVQVRLIHVRAPFVISGRGPAAEHWIAEAVWSVG